MSDVVAAALVEGAQALARVKTEEARYAYLAGRSSAYSPQVDMTNQEIILPGVELQNYTSRSEIEGGDHVLVKTHKEHIEKKFVPTPPPTPEEIAALREHKKFLAKIWAGIASVGIVVVGVIVVMERRTPPELELGIEEDN